MNASRKNSYGPNLDLVSFSMERLAPVLDAYQARWGLTLYVVDALGRLHQDSPPCPSGDCEDCVRARAWAISEGLRWGEPTVDWCPRRRLIWAVPLMVNSLLIGGLVATTEEERVFDLPPGAEPLDVRRACTDLRELAEAHNLTNAALLESNRARYLSEQMRAEAIHAFKRMNTYDLRDTYLREEPALLAAIRRNDSREARGILNRILVGVHRHAGSRFDLVKSFFMELVITMCRSAVEAGGDPASLLGANYESISELARINTEEELAPWLTIMLERILDALQNAQRGGYGQIAQALEYLRLHYAETVSRDAVAASVGMSPAHFSRCFKKHVKRGFADVLNQIRTDRACDLLIRTDRPLVLIALDAGFSDQSYFQKVFRRYTGITPRAFRLRHKRPE